MSWNFGCVNVIKQCILIMNYKTEIYGSTFIAINMFVRWCSHNKDFFLLKHRHRLLWHTRILPYVPQREKTHLLICAVYKDSNQPAYPYSLIRDFVIRMKKLCIHDYPNCASQYSDQTDLNFRWTHMHASWPWDYKTFFITQLSMKFSLLINMKMPTIVGIFIFISRETSMLIFT